MAILHKFASHSSHKADRDFQHVSKALKPGYNHFISIRSNKSLMVERGKELYYAIKGNSLQSRRDGDDANENF